MVRRSCLSKLSILLLGLLCQWTLLEIYLDVSPRVYPVVFDRGGTVYVDPVDSSYRLNTTLLRENELCSFARDLYVSFWIRSSV